MEENNTELVERQACLYMYDSNNNGPDVNFSLNIEERLQHALGHLQKDFEGGFSAENLGAKFGGYGSFLPTHERSPSIWSHSKTPQRICNTEKSSDSLPLENSKASSNLPPPLRPVAASCGANLWHNTRAAVGDVSGKQELCCPSTQATHGCPSKNETSIRSGNLTDQGSLKVRIKVGYDTTAPRNAALYSGLGLDDSPYSSSGNGPDEKEGMQPMSLDTLEQSPYDIIQVMTDFVVPGGLLVSPLADSLLWLSRKEKLHRVGKPLGSPKILPAFPTAATLGEGKVSKHKKNKSRGKEVSEVELKHVSDRSLENNMKIFKNKKSKKFPPEGKEILAKELKCASNSISGGGDSMEEICRLSDVSREFSKVRVKDTLFSSESGEHSLKSISGKECHKNDMEYSRCGLGEKVVEHKLVNSYNDNLVDFRDDGRLECKRTSAPLKDHCDISKSTEGLDLHGKASESANSHMEGENHIPSRKEKPAYESKKKLKGLQSNSDIVAASTKDCPRLETGAVTKVKKSASCHTSPSKSNIDKLKPRIDKKVRDSHLDYLRISNVEKLNDWPDVSNFDDEKKEWYIRVNKPKEKSNGLDTTERAFGDWREGSNIDDDGEMEWLQRGSKLKEKSNGNIINSQMAVVSVTDSQSASMPVAETGPICEVVSTTVAPVLVKDVWACCDSCQTWRLLPYGTDEKKLPDKWLCSMQTWLPGMNRCGISMDDSEKAFHALYQPPVSGILNNLESTTNRMKLGVPSADVRHINHNNKDFSSQTILNQRKNKFFSKEPQPSCGSGSFHVLNSTKTFLQESTKSRSLNDMKHPLPDSNHMRKSLNDTNQMKMKMKMKKEADQFGHGAGNSKKPKAEDIHFSDRHPDSKIDLGQASLISSTGFPAGAHGKDMQEYNEIGFSEDRTCATKDKILPSGKNLGEQVQDSSRTLDVTPSSKRDYFMKKRKLKEWHESQNCQNSALDSGMHLEESSENGLKRVKKSKLSKTGAKDSCTGDADFNSKKKGMVMRISTSGIRGGSVNHRGEMRDSGKEHEVIKPGMKDVSKQTLDGEDSVRRNRGSRQFSHASTSSSSKVSVSRKSDIKFDVDTMEQSGRCSDGLNGGMGHSNDGLKIKMSSHHKLLLPQNECSSLWSMDKERAFTFEFDSDKMQASEPEVKVSRKSMNYEPEVVPESGQRDSETVGDVKPSIRERLGSNLSRNENNGVHTKDFAWSTDNVVETQVKEDLEGSEVRSSLALCIKNGKVTTQQNLILESVGESKADIVPVESRSGKSKYMRHSEGEGKQERVSLSRPLLESTGPFRGCPIENHNDMLKASKDSNQNGVSHSKKQLMPDRQGYRDLVASSPNGMNSLSLAASNTLKKAQELRDYADRLKSSGFDFESNEAYFQAALKFLHGASLLEGAKSGKNGEMIQLQFYSNTAKLCEVCAQAYEKCQEMGSAALAYKCMEVAYMRVVYCKHSSTSKDRHELQASLQTAPQDESPSSSASDVDNLNNHATMDRSALSKCTGSLVTGSHVILVRNRPNFCRVLDFTQDINMAMEASRKSLNAFAVANATAEEAQYTDCVASIRRVIDFSFQDVEEFLRLIAVGLEAISRTGFGGARD